MFRLRRHWGTLPSGMWLGPRVENRLPFVFLKLRRILLFWQNRVEMHFWGQKIAAGDEAKRLKKGVENFPVLRSDCEPETVQF
jgi:hypothetical protein